MPQRKLSTFWQGFTSILSLYPESRRVRFSYRRRSDLEALREDWIKIGNDMRAAMAIEDEQQTAQHDEEPAGRR